MLAVTASALVWWMGCTQPPVFNEITEIIVQTQGPSGIARETLTPEMRTQAASCLASTEEITQDQSKTELLQEILLIQVKDRFGDRMFEFTTDENMKGNKGKYYRNRCIYRLIKHQ
jgi:hypothetical protein